MFFAEIKRKYFNIVFLLVVIISGFWLYSSLKPTASTNFDYYKYNYFKPLNKAEFVYFELVSDYKKGITMAYYEPRGNGMWGTYEKNLNNTEKGYFLDVIKKINPSYKSSEKMKNVQINISYYDMQPYLKELEEKLHILSLYYTGMNDTEYYVKKYKYTTSDNSPYWIYRNCTVRFHGKKYKDALNDFELTYKNGISKGYACVMLDSLGIIIGFITIIYSFMSYASEKKAGINGYVYTGNISSVKYVLCKYLAGIVPLMLISIIYSLLGAICFIYWNDKFNYGYDISVIPFLIQTPFIIFPTILIITAIGHFSGVLFQSGIVSVIIQFVLFYLSMGYGLGGRFSLALLIRYNNFDDYSFYQSYQGTVILDRIIITGLSIILTGFTVVLFNYRRKHSHLINLKSIKKSIINLPPVACKYKTWKKKNQERKITVTKSLGYYIFKQSVNKTVFLYIPYLCLISPIVIFKDMNISDIAITGENIFIFASMFLFIRLGNMEQDSSTESYVFTSNCFYPLVYMSRVAVAGIVLLIMTGVPVLFLCFVNHVPPGRWCIGVYCSSLFIGMFALLITELSGNYLAGYFSYIVYYLFDIVLRGNIPLSIAGYTYSMQKTKLYLAIAVAVIAVMLAVTAYLKQKGIRLINRDENRN